MKNLKIILLTFIGLTFYTCDLEEDPIFLDAEATYADLQVARGALDGIYQQLSTYMAMEQRIFAVNGFSGLFVTKKNGNNNNNVNNIPRTAQDFARYGTIILDLNNLKRGDLVFFTNTYSTSKFITHAGICLGNGEFIHTSSSKGVIISKLNDPYYWKKKFVYGTRIL